MHKRKEKVKRKKIIRHKKHKDKKEARKETKGQRHKEKLTTKARRKLAYSGQRLADRKNQEKLATESTERFTIYY